MIFATHTGYQKGYNDGYAHGFGMTALAVKTYKEALHDIAHASNAKEFHEAVEKHKDVLRECM